MILVRRQGTKDQATMTNPVRVGVIGLGPLWHKRYKPALAALHGRFRVSALYDQVEHHALAEAKRLNCVAAVGPTDLLETPDVEALLLLDAQWFRLWPVEIACCLNKPVFSCLPLEADDSHADALYEHVRAGQLAVQLEMAPRAAPVLGRLHELLETRLGPARVILCEALEALPSARRGSPDPTALPEPAGLGSATALLDCCRRLFGGEPGSVVAAELAGGALDGWLLDWGDDRAAQVVRYRGLVPRNGLRLQVVAERGTATAEFPNRLHWADAEGSHSHVGHLDRPLGQVLLEQFYRVVREGAAPEPSLEESYRLLAWARLAAKSRAEGRRVLLGCP
jgi:predicted dehydrogenase